MRYPEFLKENGTIGFVAPSFGAVSYTHLDVYKRQILENRIWA